MKIRITFVDDGDAGIKELNEAVMLVRDNFNVIEQSRIYKGRGNSKYSNVYLDIEKR